MDRTKGEKKWCTGNFTAHLYEVSNVSRYMVNMFTV